ncbi:hypothetical protein BV22DRAFT_1040932 [Leucogyrophana mollusca]|uniref:Uncharacterized protein n=1 Tax=Leucogyrophana mollusca TaxID=85980 RepID=A0ACB8B3U2_9AGAM|nr:hypothetical protein BV22DRAFT_1040932 [Leucogyrophana mollusca]
MVSADNLNLDVLELIFAHLAGNDLVSISLVSRSFLAGVIPRLYETVFFRARHAKKYTSALRSPFVTLRTHPDLAIHVRRIDIQSAPCVTIGQIHPHFVAECADAVRSCKNLSAFNCVPRILGPLLGLLQDKERLQKLRIYAALSTKQCEQLLEIKSLQSITLDFPSWNVVDNLPKWVESLRRNLTHLTLYMSQDLNETVLESTVVQLPKLLGLHVVGCSKISHVVILKTVLHTPLLEELSFTVIEPCTGTLPRSPLHRLRHLSIDVRSTIPTTTPGTLCAILSVIRPFSPPLKSFSLRLSDRQLTLWDPVLQDLLTSFASSLTHLALMECSIDIEAIRRICVRCTELVRLEVAFPAKDIRTFTTALAQSPMLHTLIDIGDSHATHGPRVALTPDDVRFLLRTVPNLRKIVSDSRIWTGRRNDYGLTVSMQRCKPSSNHHWFHPPE